MRRTMRRVRRRLRRRPVVLFVPRPDPDGTYLRALRLRVALDVASGRRDRDDLSMLEEELIQTPDWRDVELAEECLRVEEEIEARLDREG